MEQFLYKLKLIPQLLDEAKWTENDHQLVMEHFQALQGLLLENKLIMAGRTTNFDPTTFGIVILQVENEEEARRIMENDPTVKGGIMTAELFPYRVALYNENFTIEEK
ncbi:YciI family protein [Neobacillus sp. D3-1R]|uniref:YciI family protein n=1 Tax=Neobacillus sp. D3-1R TaxID=3445778 RepID=UPI003F9F3597